MKKKIGILLGQSSSYEKELYKGAKQAANELEYELIVFYGGHYATNQVVTAGASPLYKTALYSYVNEMDLEFLVIPVSSILQDKMYLRDSFFEQFNMPIILTGQPYKEYCSIYYNNDSVKDSISYMIEQGCKNIAYIGGVETGNSTQLRLQCFKETFLEKGLEWNPDLIVFAHNYTSYNKDIIYSFLDSHPEIDGIFACSDPIGICAYECLEILKREVGKDVLVCGYDDIPEIRNLLPPMASNRADPFELGYQAICIGHKKEYGEHVLRSVFVLRESMFRNHESTRGINEVLESFMDERTSHHPLRKDIESFLKERHSKNHKELLSSINRLFENSYISQIDFYDFCELVPNNFQRKVTQLYQSYQFNNLQKQIEKNVKISELVTQVNQIDFNLLQNELQEIYLDLESNIDVFTLPGAQRYTGSEFEVPTKLKHSFSLHERLVRGGKEEVLLKDILDVFDSNSKIVLPAYYNENQYGLIISDYDYLDMDLFLLLANVISSKIHSTLLIKDLNRYASYDSLTGLLNYRGFMERVKSLTETVYLMIVDLNNLKKINDTYGHQFGNIAIIGVADMLKEIFGGSIIARFGGDEFIIVYKEEISYESIILKTIENYNNTHDLPFKTHFAFGATVWNPSKENLKEAIGRADQAMYVRKKEMKKE